MSNPMVAFTPTMFILVQFLACIAFISGERVIIDESIKPFIDLPKISPGELCVNNTCYVEVHDVVVDTVVTFPDENIIFRFDQFPKIEDVFQFMSFLASNFSDHVQVFDIGYTEESLPLRVLRIASPDRINSTVWVDGGIHAREWISVTSVCFIMHVLASKWYSFSPDVQNTEFFIMPLVNPDGYRYSYTKNRMWRKNRRYNGKCYGVDLNRNFPYKWGTEHVLVKDGPRAQKKRCNEIYEGPAPVSEAESKAITEFIESSKGKFEQQWQQRKKQMTEENRQLKQSISSVVSQQEFENFRKKLNNANEMICHLKSNLNKATEEWNKREMKLIDECNQLRFKLKNTPKIVQPDVEKLQEQLKDTQEINVKLKLDLDSYKDKCGTMENLCADLKKVIMDEQIAERVYANDNIPASVKQFLSSSSSSVFSTLSHMFGCLSRSASRNRNYSYSGQKGDFFTTNESQMINDLTKSYEHNDLVKELLKEKEQLRKENQDLHRQVKELEIIVRRRAHPNFSNVNEIIRSDESRMYERESETIKNLKRELLEKQQVVIDLKNQMVESKARYDQNLLSLQSKIVSIQEESIKMKEELEKKKIVPANYVAKGKRKGRSCDPPSHSARNFRIELTAKEREVQLLNKQLEELKKTNRKLMKDRENNYLSSKEQSADCIHLSKKYSATVQESEQVGCCKHSASKQAAELDHDVQTEKQNIENGNFEFSEDVKTIPNCCDDHYKPKSRIPSDQEEHVGQASVNVPIDIGLLTEKLSPEEPNHQNLVQITCDLLKLLTKTEFANKIQNSDYSSSQYDELHRFVTALKNVSN